MADATDTTQTHTDEAASKRPFSLLETMYGEDDHADEESSEKGEEEEESVTEDHREHQAEDTEESESQEEVTVSSWDELIETQEWDPEWAESLKVPIKVDGQPTEATIKELVANYQMNSAADKRLEEAKAKARALNQELAEKSESLQSQIVAAGKLIETAEQALDAESSAIDWKRLREDDPAEYAAKKSEYAEKRERIERTKREATEAWRKATAEQQQQLQAETQKRLPAEQERLFEFFPEWKDPEKGKAGKAKTVEYLQNLGFTEDDISAVVDHRLVVMAEKARRYDERKPNVEAAKKRVAKVPKVVKPGAKKPEPKPEPKDAAEILYGG